MKFLLRLYTIYAGILFALTFLMFFPFFWISAQKVSWHWLGLRVNYIWARVYFPMIFLRVDLDVRFDLDKKKQYILCANHFSYFDIPAIARIPLDSKFIGKNSIASVPLFGYMFRKLHVTVDRASMKSRAASMIKARETIDAGFNMTFFPEGGVKSKDIPNMVTFRDGAFRLAVEKQHPIVPVTFGSNFRILPDDGKWMLHPGKLKIVLHEPLMPASTDETEIGRLRQDTFEIIQNELNSTFQIA